ncbi:5,10-methenyltetrahydromethanopterin hydrogenase cofactor biosynthesis protein HmdC [Methanocaldococcus sp.]
MRELIKEAVNDLNSALELRKLVIKKLIKNKLKESDIIEIVDAVDDLSLNEIQKLGSNLRKFPMGCDLIEVSVGPCASSLTLTQFLENCILTDYMGLTLHVCAYALADIGEKEGLTPLEVLKKVYKIVDVPLDLDHFGKYGPMRFPKEITHCMGECYYNGPPYKGCPRGRIHKRLIDKEKEYAYEFEDWIKLVSTVCINVVEEQGGEEHAAPLEEMAIVAEAAKKYGKGLEGIFHVGDGYDDLISGLKACINLDVDVLVVEGAPFNRAKDRLKAFAKAIAVSRILVKGGVVATNGAYEDECRIGLRSGLNVIISGFSGNHHGYMCGYSPKTAKRGNFGLPRVMRIIKEELKNINDVNLINKNDLIAIARSSKFLGNVIYPEMFGGMFIGDAHWVAVKNSKLHDKVKIRKNLEDVEKEYNGERLGLLGGRYIAWGIVKRTMPEEVYVSDANKWVEEATVKIFNEFGINAYKCNGNDNEVVKNADKTYICSMIPEIILKIKNKVNAESFI